MGSCKSYPGIMNFTRKGFEGKVVDHETIAENFVGFENNARP